MLSQKETRLESGSPYSGLMPPLAPSPLLRSQDGTWLPVPSRGCHGIQRQHKPKCTATRGGLRVARRAWAGPPQLTCSPGLTFQRPTQKGKINNTPALGNKACLLGTPDTSRSGRNTRKARRALTSKPPDLPPEWLPPSVSLVNCSKITLNNLKEEERKKR